MGSFRRMVCIFFPDPGSTHHTGSLEVRTSTIGTAFLRACANLKNMRTIYTTALALFAIFAAPTFSAAQGPAFGVKGGLNLTTLAVNEADDENARLGFNAGIFARTMPSSPFGVQVELLYSTRGSKSSYSGFFDLVDQEVDFNLNYLELPVLASFRIGEIVDLQLGAYAAYLLSANISTSGDLGSGREDLDRDNFRSVDYGIAGGVGFNLGPTAQVGVRYLHGLNNVADGDAAEFLLDDAKNRCAQIYLAFGIGGGE